MAAAVVVAVLALSGSPQSDAAVSKVRKVEPENLITIKSPAGWLFLEGQGRVVFPPKAETVLLFDKPSDRAATVVLADPQAEDSFFAAAELEVSDSINMAFAEPQGIGRLVLFDGSKVELIEVRSQGRCCDRPGLPSRHEASGLGIAMPAGMAIDPESGDLFILDAATSRVLRLQPDVDAGYSVDRAVAEGRVSEYGLQVDATHLRGLAFEPDNGHLFTVNTATRSLLEFAPSGALYAVHELHGVGVRHLTGLAISQSLDRTDSPKTMHLFVATATGVFEFSLK